MEIRQTLAEGLNHEFNVTIPSSEIESALTKRLEVLGRQVKIPGFRPGKVPVFLLKQRYQETALHDVLTNLTDKAVKKALEDYKIKPALQPTVTPSPYEEGKNLTLSIKLEALPVIEDIDLKGFSFEKYVVPIPSEQINNALTDLAKRNRKSSPLPKPRKSKKGDVVIIDFKGFVEGHPIEGGEGKDYSLELGSNSFIPGFEDQLINQEKGASVSVDVTFPKAYHNETYANKPAHFDVTLKDIHVLEDAKIDEDLAKNLGFKSLDGLKEWIEANLSQEYIAQSLLNTKRQVFDALAARFAFAVPQSMVDLEFNSIWAQLLKELKIDEKAAANTNGKTFKEETGKTEDELRKEYRKIADRRVRLGILLSEIGKRHNISVSQNELVQALTKRAQEFPGQEQKVFDYYRNSESAMASLRAPLFENKVVDFILSQSTVKEIPTTSEKLEKILLAEEDKAVKKPVSTNKKQKKAK